MLMPRAPPLAMKMRWGYRADEAWLSLLPGPETVTASRGSHAGAHAFSRSMVMALGAAPGHENAVAVSGGWGMVGATPEDRPVVAGSGAPDLFGEAENELMCPAS